MFSSDWRKGRTSVRLRNALRFKRVVRRRSVAVIKPKTRLHLIDVFFFREAPPRDGGTAQTEADSPQRSSQVN